MSLFRSEQMKYYQLSMARETAWDVLNELGSKSIIQFVDQNEHEPMFQRKYASMIKRIDEADLKLKEISNTMNRFNSPILKCDDFKKYINRLQQYMKTRNTSEKGYYDEIEQDIDSKYKKLIENVQTFDEMKKQLDHYSDYKQVLIRNESIIHSIANDFGKNDIENEGTTRTLKFIFGVVSLDNLERFKRMVFRASKGSTLMYTHNYDQQVEQNSNEDQIYSQNQFQIAKNIIMLTFPDGSQRILDNKVKKICESLGVDQYDVPLNRKMFKEKLDEVDKQIIELKNSLNLTKKFITDLLVIFSEVRNEMDCSYVEEIMVFLMKERILYTNMNLLKHKEYEYTGFCWVANQDEGQFRVVIDQLKNKQHIKGISYSCLDRHQFNLQPPTFFKTNSFTGPFQLIVDTYGIPRYGEINPGLFAIPFFPFLFGVMFGDIGHGGLLFLFGLYLIQNAEEIKKDKENMLNMIIDNKYLFTMMGFFGLYSGFIYNDFLAIPWNLFGSCYVNHDKVAEKIVDCVYPFGMDPKWYSSNNELTYFNSLKMKMAVIIGVAQMSFGVILKGINSIHFGLYIDFIFEFIPQLIFMTITFGYMCFCIIYKWLTPWENYDLLEHPAPGIINIMINMPLKLGSTEGQPLYDKDLQEQIQYTYFITALIMVPIMLFVKPLLLLCFAPKSSSKQIDDHMTVVEPLIEKSNNHGHGGGHGHGEFDFGEVFVHQVIETIEFVLGSISNTASYLRLWALSLAHGQLARVFFEKTIGGGIVSGSFLATFIGWFLFANITFAVIMCMDMMECFLHALRLQWVEFQNKFYKADGYKFIPFDYAEQMRQQSIKE